MADTQTVKVPTMTPTPADILAGLPPGVTDVSKSSAAAALVEAINNRVIESGNSMNRWSIPTRLATNMELALNGSRDVDRPTKYYRCNKIGPACLANAAVQVGDAPTLKVKPRESGEPDLCYLNPQVRLAPQVMQGLLARTKLRPETQATPDGQQEPLNDTEVALLKDEIAQSQFRKQQAQAARLPPPLDLIPPETLLECNDHMEAEAAQTLLDEDGERSNFPHAIREHTQYLNIFGFQYLLTEWLDDEWRHRFRNVEAVSIYVDPYRTTIEEGAYLVFDQFMDADEGRATYPQLADAIDANKTQGPPTPPGYVPNRMPQPWYQAFLGREVIIIRDAWLRHQPYPLSPDDALQMGKVTVVPVPMTPPKTDDGQGLGLLGKIGRALGFGGGKNGEDGGGQEDRTSAGSGGGNQPNGASSGISDVHEQDADSEAGGKANGSRSQLPSASPTRAAFHLIGKDGQPDLATGEVTPTHRKWPVRMGLRRVRIIAGTLYADAEAETIDIPFGKTVNIPIPFTPYGQGEPERLEPLQEAYNDALTDNVMSGRHSAFPAKLVLASVAKDNPDLAKNAYTRVNVTAKVDDKVAAQAGGLDKTVMYAKAPELPADSWKRLDMLDQAFDKESDQANVLRGQTPGRSSMNPDTVGQLQSAAKTSITFKAAGIESMLEYTGRIRLANYVLRLTPVQLAAKIRKYPACVWAELHRRIKGDKASGLKPGYLECDIGFAVASGASGANASETAQMVAESGGKVPWSPQTLIERRGGDPELEMQQMAQWQRDQAAAVQAQQTTGVAVAPPPGQAATQEQAAPASAPYVTGNAPPDTRPFQPVGATV